MRRSFSVLCLTVGALGILGAPSFSPSAAYAQGNLENRLNRLENEMETMGRAIYRGEKPPANHSFSSSSSASNAGDLEVRFQQLESQMRDLTGRIEQQSFDQQQILKRLDAIETDQKNQAAQWANDKRANDKRDTHVQQHSQSQNENLNRTRHSSQDGPSAGLKTVRPMPGKDAASQYEQAFAYIKSGDYAAAEKAFAAFLEGHKDHALTPNAMYWLAESHYVRDQYDEAAKAFAEAYQKYPGGPKGADNLLKLGMSLSGLGKIQEACIALGQLKREYPNGPATIIRRGEQEQDRLKCR